jgi:hypothetical protein
MKTITSSPATAPPQFFEIARLAKENVDVYDQIRLTGKAMGEVDPMPGMSELGEWVFNENGKLRDYNNALIDQLLQEAAASQQ